MTLFDVVFPSNVERAAIPFIIFVMFIVSFIITVFCVICFKRCYRWCDNNKIYGHKIYAIDIHQPEEQDNKVHVIDVYPQQE